MPETMSDAHVAEAAARLAEAYRSGTQIPQFPIALRARSASDAERIQDALVDALGWSAVGWKVGHNSVAARARLGPDAPVTGRLFEHMVVDSPAVVAVADVCAPIVEAEIAVRMGRDLPPRPSEYSHAEVIDAIETVMPALEFPDFRHDWSGGFDPFTALEVTASNAGTFRLVLGPSLADWSPERLASLTVEIVVDGTVRARELTGDLRADPLWTLHYLVNDLSRRGVGLGRGQVVTTGLMAEAVPLDTEAQVVVVFHEVGEVLLSLV